MPAKRTRKLVMRVSIPASGSLADLSSAAGTSSERAYALWEDLRDLRSK